MNAHIGKIVLVHSVKLTVDGNFLLEMNDFSSISFTYIYPNAHLSSSVKFNQLDYTSAYVKLQKCIDEVVEYINLQGGFTVVGWYKRGEINDQSNDDSQNEVESSEIGFHVVSISPTDRKVMDHSTLKVKQFDITNPDI